MEPDRQRQRTANFKKYLVVIALFAVAGIFATPLVVNNELHDPTRTGKIFFFATWMLLVIPIGLIVFIRNWNEQLDKLSLFILIWFAWIFIRGKLGGIWHDEKFFWLAGCFAFFFLARGVLTDTVKEKQQHLLFIPVAVITMVAGAEAVMGLLQLYGGFRIYHGIYKVTGTFFNPAPYAGFLLASLPWVLLLYSKPLTPARLRHSGGPKGECPPLTRVLPFRGVRGVSEGRHNLKHGITLFFTTIKKQNLFRHILHWTGFVTTLLIIVVIPSTQSRAAYLGLMAAVTVWAFFRYKPFLYVKHILNTRLKKRLAFITVPVIFLVLFTSFYLFKKDSADGRLLIWKVALQTIKEKPFAGHGFNTVQATLAPAQAAYFATGKGSDNEKMLAGSVRWAFNEPLQAASETGLVGMFFLLLVTAYALFYKISRPISRTQYLQIGAARASLAGIVVFGCFSYPFHSLPITLLFFYALAVLASFKTNTINRQNLFVTSGLKTLVLAGTILLGIFYTVKTPKLKRAYWLWDEANSLYQVDAYAEASESFAEAFPVLQHNGLFLQEYAKCMAMGNRHKEALTLLLEAGNYYKDEFSSIALGDVYKATEEYQKAEEQYLLAANMVPHKFYPLYLLARLYHETGQKEKAVILSRQILNKKVKVPSTAIDEIKKEMKEIIDKQTSLQSSNESLGKGQEANVRKQSTSCPAPYPIKKGGEVTKIKI